MEKLIVSVHRLRAGAMWCAGVTQ